MAAALIKIKAFVQTYTGYNFENISDIEIVELKIFLAEAFQAIRWEVENELENQVDDNDKSLYIGDLQYQLNHLAGGLTSFDCDKQNTVILSAVFEWVLTGIFEFHEHLQIYFKPYFNFDGELPLGYIERHKQINPIFGHELLRKLSEREVDQDLINLIKNYCEATQHSEKFSLHTWKQWDYHLYLIKTISNHIDDVTTGDTNLEVLKLLVSGDFNSIQLYVFFIKYVEKITLGESTFQEQQEKLLYLLKIFRQVRVDAYAMYNSQVQSLKVSIIECLEAELSYLEQKEKLFTQSFKSTQSDAPSKFYFTVAVTLAELMFFFRVMLEVKVIYTKFNSYLYEFVSNHIKTANAENISKKSQRNHFNNKPFPDRVVQNVKTWLEKMLAHIHLYYDI